MSIEDIIQALTDPENQPHQFVDAPESLIQCLFGRYEIKTIEVNNLLHGFDTGREMIQIGWRHIGDFKNRMIFARKFPPPHAETPMEKVERLKAEVQ